MNETDNNALNTAFEHGMRAAPQFTTDDGAVHAVVPQGSRIETLKPADPKLTRIRQSVTMHEAENTEWKHMSETTLGTDVEILSALFIISVFVTGYLIGVRSERRYANHATQDMLNKLSEDYRQ
jgi:hypothetical protein